MTLASGMRHETDAPAFAVMFDLNGTMIDDAGYTFEAWRQTFALAGRTLTRDEFDRNVAGMGAADVVAYLLGHDAPEGVARTYAAEKYRIYADLVHARAAEVPGLRSLVEELTSARVPLAVVSSARPSTVDLVLESLRLRHFFQVVVDASHAVRAKPAPDPYLRAATLLGAVPERCLVFEDAPPGVIAAKAAGMTCIGIATSVQPRLLFAAGADLVYPSFVGLTKALLEAIVLGESPRRPRGNDQQPMEHR